MKKRKSIGTMGLLAAPSLSLGSISDLKPPAPAQAPKDVQLPRFDLNREQRRSMKYGKKKGW